MDSTIAAIATAPFPAGIGIVRISGPGSLSILSALAQKDKDFFKPHLLRLIWAHSSQGKLIDRAFAVYLPAPRTYSGEDMAEVQCHGGLTILRTVLSTVLDFGAVLATPGEFTRRAFLSGRLDLVQAEAVASLIQAPNARAVENALRQLRGALSDEISSIQEALCKILAQLEASIDFPEEVDIPAESLRLALQEVRDDLGHLWKKAEAGESFFKRWQVVILGRPNVGKSSLLNALLGKEHAIVTSLPGTTRDSLEGELSMRQRTIRLIDTAGLGHDGGELERRAMERTRQMLSLADLVLFLVDISQPPQEEDRSILEELKGKNLLLVGNKLDLGDHVSWSEFPLPVCAKISALKGTNLLSLLSLMEKYFEDQATDDELWWLNARQRHLVKKALESCERALSLLAVAPADILCAELRETHAALLELLGGNMSPQVLESIFSQFCLGK